MKIQKYTMMAIGIVNVCQAVELDRVDIIRDVEKMLQALEDTLLAQKQITPQRIGDD